MSENGVEPWLVLRTRSRHENTVEQGLQQKCINAYLPKRKLVRRWKNQKRVVELLLFPVYVFVQPRADQYENIRYIRGTCGLVLAGSQPANKPEKDLETLRILVGSGAELAVDCMLTPGQRVRVIAGPFASAEGEMVRMKMQERLIINVHLLSSSVSVEVYADMVELV